MPIRRSVKRYRKFMIYAASFLLLGFLVFFIFVDRVVEPLLRDRIHTLIIQGSDSLYTYKLGDLKANFFGGNVEVESLQISVDSNRYRELRSRNALPSLTMRLDLGRGRIRGIGLIALIFGKKVQVEEILSKDANLKLTRHVQAKSTGGQNNLPLWKAIQPKITSIDIGRIRLEGIKMNYKNADTSESLKVEFEGCDALFSGIRIDSAAAADTNRIGFTQEITLRLDELKYRTPDSSYKLKANVLHYSSVKRTLEIDSFKFQPTLDREGFYKDKVYQESMYIVKIHKVRFTRLLLDQFIRNNIIQADSVVIDRPTVVIYNDRSLLPNFESKIGRYPHQQLLKAATAIRIKNISMTGGNLEYTEKNPKTQQEGVLRLAGMRMDAQNITNDRAFIQKNPVCTTRFRADIFGTSPVDAVFHLRLDSLDGQYDATGTVGNVSASQLNTVAEPLGNVRLNSVAIQQISFRVHAADYESVADVRMRYHGLSITIRKTDEETGVTSTKKFITKLLNRYVLWSDNPGPDGIERVAQQRKVSRLTTQSFFGFFWKSIFAGIQDIMLKSGRVT